jgi:hypothetical protein
MSDLGKYRPPTDDAMRREEEVEEVPSFAEDVDALDAERLFELALDFDDEEDESDLLSESESDSELAEAKSEPESLSDAVADPEADECESESDSESDELEDDDEDEDDDTLLAGDADLDTSFSTTLGTAG